MRKNVATEEHAEQPEQPDMVGQWDGRCTWVAYVVGVTTKPRRVWRETRVALVVA